MCRQHSCCTHRSPNWNTSTSMLDPESTQSVHSFGMFEPDGSSVLCSQSCSRFDTFCSHKEASILRRDTVCRFLRHDGRGKSMWRLKRRSKWFYTLRREANLSLRDIQTERISEYQSKGIYRRDETKPRIVWNHLVPDEEAPLPDFRWRSTIFLAKGRSFFASFFLWMSFSLSVPY